VTKYGVNEARTGKFEGCNSYRHGEQFFF